MKVMSVVDLWREEGREEGRQEGLQEGQLIGQINMIKKFLGQAQILEKELVSKKEAELKQLLNDLEKQLAARVKK